MAYIAAGSDDFLQEALLNLFVYSTHLRMYRWGGAVRAAAANPRLTYAEAMAAAGG